MPKVIADKTQRPTPKATTVKPSADLTKGLATPEQYKEEHAKKSTFNKQMRTFNNAWKAYVDDAVKARLADEMAENLKGVSGSEVCSVRVRTRRAQLAKITNELAERGIKEPAKLKLTDWSNAIRKAGKNYRGGKVGSFTTSFLSVDSYKHQYDLLTTFSRDKQAAEKAKRYAETTKQHEAAKRAFDRETKRQDHAELMRRFHEAEIRQQEEAKRTGKPAPGFVVLEF